MWDMIKCKTCETLLPKKSNMGRPPKFCKPCHKKQRHKVSAAHYRSLSEEDRRAMLQAYARRYRLNKIRAGHGTLIKKSEINCTEVPD